MLASISRPNARRKGLEKPRNNGDRLRRQSVEHDTFYMEVGRVSEITCLAISIYFWLSFKLSHVIHKLSLPVSATVRFRETSFTISPPSPSRVQCED